MADNLYSRYGNSDNNTEGPLRFVDIGSVYYAVSILAKADGTLVDAATSSKQDTIIGHLDGVEGLLTTIDADTGGIATSAASIDGKITACNTGAVVVASSALPSGAATAAKQPALGTAGTASADVITVQGIASMTALKVDGSAVTQPVSLASAVAVTDNSGSLTVDAPVGTPVFVRLSDGTSAISTLPVSLASVPSHAVTNAGTFAVQAAQSGTWTVGLSASQTLATVTTVTTVTTCSTLTTLTGGGVAHDGVDSGNPIKVGGRALAGLSGTTLVAASDRSDLITGLDGALLVRGTPLEDIVSGVASITDGSSTSVIAAQGAGVKVYLTDVTIANSSATAVIVDIRDGAAGSVKWTFPAPANTSGVTHRFGSPIPFSANTAVCADPSAAASTVTVSIAGFKSKI